MTRHSRYSLALLLPTMLLTSILAQCTLLRPPTPSGVPEDWERHTSVLGRFEVWLPDGWRQLGTIRTLLRRVHESAQGYSLRFELSAASSPQDDCPEWIEIRSYNKASESYARLSEEERAVECCRMHPVTLTTDCSIAECIDTTKVMTVTLGCGQGIGAYQSTVLRPSADGNFVRTFACVVLEDRLYQVYLTTVEESNEVVSPLHEAILETFRTPE